MLLQIVLLLVGFVILIKGADWLVKGSVSLARFYNVSELIIGLTIVAFGTSAPELVVNIISSVKGYNDVTMGNIVGSNLFNLLLILGISSIIYPISVHIKTIKHEIPFSLIAALVLFGLANYTFNKNEGMSVDRIDGMVLLICFILFMVYIFIDMKKNPETIDTDIKQERLWLSVVFIVLGLTGLVIASRIVVDSAVKIAHLFKVSEKIIGVTILSAGTSLPELVTSVVAAYHKKSDIAIGNIIGSNIFNILLILGVSSCIAPIHYNPSFNTDLILLIVSTIMLLLFMFSGKRCKIDRWEGTLTLAIYVGYIFYLLR